MIVFQTFVFSFDFSAHFFILSSKEEVLTFLLLLMGSILFLEDEHHFNLSLSLLCAEYLDT